jgi:hypothetical protein
MAVANFTVVEGKTHAIPFTMTYADDWITAAKQGDPIAKTEITNLYFYIKRRATDETARIELSDASATEIEWTDEINGEILVHLNDNTEGYAGYNDYELAVEFPDGSYTSLEIGKMYITESVVDTP